MNLASRSSGRKIRTFFSVDKLRLGDVLGYFAVRILAPCFTCIQKRREAGEQPAIVLFRGRMSDDGYVTVQCNEGHKTFVVYDQRRHDLLFESTCLALSDGYEREAVASFAAGLERVREFWLRVVYRSVSIQSEEFTHTWAQMTRQSERQLGAFLISYLHRHGKSFHENQKMTAFRNKVIHQGYIPKYGEAHAYGQHVFSIKRNLVKGLEKDCAAAVAAEVENEIANVRLKVPDGQVAPMFKAIPASVNPATRIAQEIDDFDFFLSAMQKQLDFVRGYSDRL